MNTVPSSKPKAIIMGIDQIVTSINPWFEFLRELHIDWEKEQEMYRLIKDGKARWEELKEQMIPIPKGKGDRVHRSRFENTVATIAVRGDAIATVGELQQRGYVLGIVSGSIDLIVESVAKRLHINDWFANATLSFDSHGYWTDIDFIQAESGLKLEQALQFMKKYRLKPEEIMVVGHSDADIEMFQAFPAISLGKVSDELRALSWEHIEYFSRILQILNRFE